MMKKETRIYTVKELLQNDSFLRWKLFAGSDDEKYWEEYLEKNPQEKETIDRASRITRMLRLNDYAFTSEENTFMMKAIEEKIRKQKAGRRKTFGFLLAPVAAAAIFLAILFIPGGLRKTDVPPGQQASAEAIDDSGNIRMLLGDESIVFDKDADFEYSENGKITASTADGEVITKTAKASLNKLIVPKGKRSSLTLADGSKIWINSGSVLEFPSTFEAEDREIFVDGEIYIEVARNEDKPFVVRTRQLSVRVLGTSFNLSAYGEDPVSFVVLVEGKVEVEVAAANEKVSLLPNQILSLKETDIITKQVDVDVYEYVCWKDGLMQFSSEPLPNILTKLSRYYDKHIYWEENVTSMNGTGKLVLFDSIDNVLETLQKTLSVSYENREDGIYIRSK